MADDLKTVKSPCVGGCDVHEGLCMGCFRTIHEVCDWHSMSDDRRRALLAETELRRKEFKAASDG